MIETIKEGVLSEKTRGQKISDSLKGHFVSEETRRKIGDANSRRAWSEESRKKISESSIGRKVSDETKRKMSEASRGHIVSEETREKMRERVVSAETRKKIGDTSRGRIASEETRMKMSKIRKNPSKETRMKMSNSHQGFKHSNESKEKMSKAQIGNKKSLGCKRSAETRRKMGGENNGSWKGGVTPLMHIIRNSLEYIQWRGSVFERDCFTCQLCNQWGGNLHAHHIVTVSDNPRLIFFLDNGITLCKKCHDSIHGQEDTFMEYISTRYNVSGES